MAKLVTGIFKNRSNAMLAVEDLIRHGFPQEDISVMLPDTATGREFFTVPATKAPEMGMFGTIIGGLLGAACFGLAAVGYSADPTPIAEGTIAALAGAGAGGTIGMLVGSLVGMTIPEFESQMFSLDHRHGGLLVGVYTHPKRARESAKVMDAAGAKSIQTKTIKNETLRHYAAAQELQPTTVGERLAERRELVGNDADLEMERREIERRNLERRDGI